MVVVQEILLVSQHLVWRNVYVMHVVKSIDGRHHWEDISKKSVEENLISNVHSVQVKPS